MTAATTSQRGSNFLPSDIQDDMYSPAFRLLSGCFFHKGRRTRTENREILSYEVSASRKPMRLSLLCLTSCFLDASLNTMICLPRYISVRQFTAKPLFANLNPSDSAESNLACQGNDGGGGITIDKFLSTRPCIYTVLVQASFRKHTFIIDHHSLTFSVEHYNSETRILGH